MEEIKNETAEKPKEDSEEFSIDLKSIGAFVKKHKIWFVYGALLLIVVLAFVSRVQNVPNLEGKYLVSPDDPYYFLRASTEVYENGKLAEMDNLRYYPDGQTTKFENNFMAYLAGYTLKAAKIFFPEADMFDVAAWLSPSLLVLGLIGFFFLSKEIFEDDRIALIATGFLAFSNAIFFRTTAGFLEKEPIFLPMFCFAMWFFVKSYKKKDKSMYLWVALAGIFTGLAGFSSGLTAFVYLFVGVFALAECVLHKMNKKKLSLFAVWFFVSVVVTALLTSKYGILTNPISLVTGFDRMIVAFGLIISAIYCFVPKPKQVDFIPKGIYAVLIGIIVSFMLGLLIFGPAGMENIIVSLGSKVLQPAGTDRMALSVSENQAPAFLGGRGWLGTFGVSFMIPIINKSVSFGAIFFLFFAGSLVLFYNEFKFSKYKWFMLAGFILLMCSLIFENVGSSNFGWLQTLLGNQLLYMGLFAGIFIAFLFLERGKDEKLEKINSIFLFVLIWFGISTVAANGAVRLFFVLAFSLVLIAAYFVIWAVDKIQELDKYKWINYIIYGLVIAIILLNLRVVYLTNSQMYPGLGNWYESMDWINQNTDESAVFTHWWDYGYLIQTMGGRATVGDPGNFHAERNYDIGGYLFNSKNNSEALKFLDKYSRPDYLLICSEDVFKFYQIARLGSLSELYGPLPESGSLGRESYFSTYAVQSQEKVIPNNIYEPDKYPLVAIYESSSGPSQLLEQFRSGNKVYDAEYTFVTAYLVTVDKNGSYGPVFVQLFNQITQKSEIFPAKCECIYKEGCSDLNNSENSAPVCFYNFNNGALLNVPYKTRDILFTQLYLLDMNVPGFEQVYESSVPLTYNSIHGQGTNIKIYQYDYDALEENPER